MRPTESWLPTAQTLGFDSEAEMLKHMYIAQGFSLQMMSDILGYSVFAVLYRLRKLNVPIKGRGGANNRHKNKLKDVSDSDLFTMNAKETAIAYGVHICTVFNERRRRRALLPDNADEGVSTVRS